MISEFEIYTIVTAALPTHDSVKSLLLWRNRLHIHSIDFNCVLVLWAFARRTAKLATSSRVQLFKSNKRIERERKKNWWQIVCESIRRHKRKFARTHTHTHKSKWVSTHCNVDICIIIRKLLCILRTTQIESAESKISLCNVLRLEKSCAIKLNSTNAFGKGALNTTTTYFLFFLLSVPFLFRSIRHVEMDVKIRRKTYVHDQRWASVNANNQIALQTFWQCYNNAFKVHSERWNAHIVHRMESRLVQKQTSASCEQIARNSN